MRSICSRVLLRREGAKARKEIAWNVSKASLLKAMSQRLNEHEVGVRNKINAERNFIQALKDQERRERSEREKMNAEWEYFSYQAAKEAEEEQKKAKRDATERVTERSKGI